MWITIWGTSLSMLFIVGLERFACHIRGTPLAAWQRWLIPIPIILIVGSNLDSVLSLQAWLETHPDGMTLRYMENQAWDGDRFFMPGLISAALTPFAMINNSGNQWVRIVIRFWFGYLMWIFIVMAPLWVSTGVPLQD